jgi:dolichyl-phosphate-mannose-protein mannosyltransferase
MICKSRKLHELALSSPALDICVLLAIVFLGFALRYCEVGKDSFWLDEAGQALAAIQPHLSDTFTIVRQHAGAMPLDYLVSRFVASFTLDEKFMRLPSVVWGTLSIIAFFLLVREMNIPRARPVSFLAAVLLALSPVHIQYSQEMRFYAALVFFYVASTLLLIRAIKTPSVTGWLFYTLVTLVGEYFHPYVLFTAITGLVLIVGTQISRTNFGLKLPWDANGLRKFAISSLLLIALYVPGYLYFNAGQTFSSALNFHGDLVLQGLGLQAIRLESGVGPFGLWHIFLIVGAIGGLFIVMKRYRPYWLLVCLLIACVLQFVLIVCLDAYKHYFFSARQIIHLAPLVLLLVSIFLVECIAAIKLRVVEFGAAAVILAGIGACASPYIKAIYDYSKGSGKEIAQIIISRYRPNQEVLVLSSNYRVVLDYYFLRYRIPGRQLPAILTLDDFDELGRMVASIPEIEYVVTPRATSSDIRTRIVSLGFKAAPKSRSDFLFVRSP